MFGFLQNSRKVVELTTQKALLEGKIKDLEEKLDIFRSKEDTTQQDFSIDFNKMDVFSIERNGDKHQPCTIIGHFMHQADGTKTTSEWYLYCSPTTHTRLVKEFNDSKGTNGTK